MFPLPVAAVNRRDISVRLWDKEKTETEEEIVIINF